MTTKNKILIVCTIILLATITIILFLFLRNKSIIPGQQLTLANISPENNIAFAQIHGQNLYFVKDNDVVENLDLASSKISELFRASGNIENLVFSPDYKKAYFKQNSNEKYSNWYFDGSKTLVANNCLNTLAWKADSNGIFFNCVNQESEYDPNTVNSLNDAAAGEIEGKNIYNFEIDPPKKLYVLDDQKIIILTASPGYQSNDLLFLDLKTKKTENLTKNGLVQDAKIIDNQKILYDVTKDGNKSGIYLFDLAGQESIPLPEEVDNFDLVTSFSGKIYFQRLENNGAIIEKWSPQSDQTTSTSSAFFVNQEQIAQVGKVEKLLATKDGFVLICEKGIYFLKVNLG